MALHPKNNLVHGPKRSAPGRVVDVRTGKPVKQTAKVKRAIEAARTKMPDRFKT